MVGFKSLPICQQGFELRANISRGSVRVKRILLIARRRRRVLRSGVRVRLAGPRRETTWGMCPRRRDAKLS